MIAETVTSLKEEFDSWRGLPADTALRHLSEREKQRQHLAKAAEIARENKQEEAIKHLEACLEPDMEPFDRATAKGLIGNAYLAISKLTEAEAAYRDALDAAEAIAEAKEKKEITADALGNMGVVYKVKGDLDKALDHYQQALKIDREITNRVGEANQLGNMGIVYEMKGEMNKALGHYQQALKIHRDVGNREGEASALGNMGVVYQIKGELDKALEHFQQALRIFEEIGASLQVEQTKRNIQ